MKKLLLLLIILAPFAKQSFAQDKHLNKHLIDSLQLLLKTAKEDTNKVKILIRLAEVYWLRDHDKDLDCSNQALYLSDKIGYKKGIAESYWRMGNVKRALGDYSLALVFYKKGLNNFEQINNKKDIAKCYNSIGGTYALKCNYPEALKNYYLSLKIREEIGDKGGIGQNYINIGEVFAEQRNYPEALKYYFASLKIADEKKGGNGVAWIYIGIATAYYYMGNYTKALKYAFAGLNLTLQTGATNGQALLHTIIAKIYAKQGKYQEGLFNILKALHFFEEIKDNKGIADSYATIGILYRKQKKFKDAKQYLDKSLSLAKEINQLDGIRDIYEELTILDSSQGNFTQALEHYKLYIVYRDSIINEEKTTNITQQKMQFEYDKKEAVAKAKEDMKDAMIQKEVHKQKWLRNGFLGGFVLVFLFALVFLGQRIKLNREKMKSDYAKKRSDELLLNILPYEVAEELKLTGTSKVKTFSMVSVMFTDFKDFTKISESVCAELLVDEVHYCFCAFDAIMHKYKIEKIKTIGDAYLCASGLPVLNHTHATDIVNAAIEIIIFMLERKKEKESKGEFAFELRIGIHTGPVVAGIVGMKKFAYDIYGDTVNIAARMEQNSQAGRINISGNTYHLVKDKFTCIHRGKIEVKNKGEIDMYFVEANGTPE